MIEVRQLQIFGSTTDVRRSALFFFPFSEGQFLRAGDQLSHYTSLQSRLITLRATWHAT